MYVTAPVAATSYRGRMGETLTHLCDRDAIGVIVSVACGKVYRTSILDDLSQHTSDRPTCALCAKKWDRLSRSHK